MTEKAKTWQRICDAKNPKRVYAVTMRTQAEMVVWVEARSNAGAKLLAEAGEYEEMTAWEPRDYLRVKAAKARLSDWPADHIEHAQ